MCSLPPTAHWDTAAAGSGSGGSGSASSQPSLDRGADATLVSRLRLGYRLGGAPAVLLTQEVLRRYGGILTALLQASAACSRGVGSS